MLAYLENDALKLLEVNEGLRAAARVAQKRGGVVKRHAPSSVYLVPLTVLLGDAEIRAYVCHCSYSAQADNDFGADKLYLLRQPLAARCLLDIKRVTVLGRAALDHIGNVYFAAVKPYHLEHIVQQLAGSADKGFALKILLLTGTFTDEHDLRVRVPNAENDIRASLPKRAFFAAQAG
jgi:hypothetical protein